MTCPYCNANIPAFTGLQEAQKFQKHLRRCAKKPANVPAKPTLFQAVHIRSESGQ